MSSAMAPTRTWKARGNPKVVDPRTFSHSGTFPEQEHLSGRGAGLNGLYRRARQAKSAILPHPRRPLGSTRHLRGAPVLYSSLPAGRPVRMPASESHVWKGHHPCTCPPAVLPTGRLVRQPPRARRATTCERSHPKASASLYACHFGPHRPPARSFWPCPLLYFLMRAPQVFRYDVSCPIRSPVGSPALLVPL